MIRFIDKACTGKTAKLIEAAAADPNSIIVCARPQHMIEKAYNLGYTDISVFSYHDYWSYCGVTAYQNRTWYIDELEQLMLNWDTNIRAYSLSTEDK